MTTEFGFQVIDADNHYYEPRDAFTRFIEPKHRDLAIHVIDGGEQPQIMIGDRPYVFTRPFYDTVGKPGSLRERMRQIKAGNADVAREKFVVEVAPEFVDRDKRLKVMDAQGVQASLMLPSLGVGVEHYMKDDVTRLYANLRAFNRWVDEDWGFDYQGRIFSAALLNLTDLDQAVAELEWALGRGARVVHLRPAPVNGRSLADPMFDPFWARIQESGTLVAFHISECGYNESVSTLWGEAANPPVLEMSAWQWTCAYGDRTIMDTIAALILHNLFGRFPGVKVASVEHGSLWVRYLLSAMDKYRGMGWNGKWIGGPVLDKPSRIFKQHVYVSPFHEENLVELVDLIGADQVLFGSDYPHPEGIEKPLDYADRLEGLDDVSIRKVMRDNAAQLLRV